MTEQEYRERHEAFMKDLHNLDRQYAFDPEASKEELDWLESRMNEIINRQNNESNTSIYSGQ